MESQIEIYQGSDGQTQIEVKFEQDTVWLSQEQIVELFGKGRTKISEHIVRVYLRRKVLLMRLFYKITNYGTVSAFIGLKLNMVAGTY